MILLFTAAPARSRVYRPSCDRQVRNAIRIRMSNEKYPFGESGLWLPHMTLPFIKKDWFP